MSHSRIRTDKKAESANQGQYKQLVRSIRDHRAQGGRHEVEAMCLVLELERQPHLWDSWATSFMQVIEKEKFCTVRCWKHFKKARGGFGRQDKFLEVARSLGVKSLCLIAAQPSKTKNLNIRLVRKAQTFRNNHEVEPTYQYITRLIGKPKRHVGPTRKDLLEQVEVLQRNVETLKGVLRQRKIKLPALERVS